MAAVAGLAILTAALLLDSPRRQRRLTFWLERGRDRGAVIFLGDSITERWTNLAAAFPEWTVANRGLDGDRTSEILDRLGPDVLALRPAAVVLLIGTNDLNGGADPQTVLVNLREIVRRLRAPSPRLPVVICKLMPRAPEPGRFPDQILRFNAMLDTAFPADPATLVCDTWSPFANPLGLPSKEHFPDGLHPSPGAYAQWAAVLRPRLQRLLPPASDRETR